MKIYVAKLMFSYLEDLVCEPETWEVRKKMIDMSEIYETLRTSTLRKVTYEDDEISIVAYKVGKIIRIDVKEIN